MTFNSSSATGPIIIRTCLNAKFLTDREVGFPIAERARKTFTDSVFHHHKRKVRNLYLDFEIYTLYQLPICVAVQFIGSFAYVSSEY